MVHPTLQLHPIGLAPALTTHLERAGAVEPTFKLSPHASLGERFADEALVVRDLNLSFEPAIFPLIDLTSLRLTTIINIRSTSNPIPIFEAQVQSQCPTLRIALAQANLLVTNLEPLINATNSPNTPAANILQPSKRVPFKQQTIHLLHSLSASTSPTAGQNPSPPQPLCARSSASEYSISFQKTLLRLGLKNWRGMQG